MSITSALVLFAVVWFMTFLIALPIRTRTQGDIGEVVPGTHAGAPEHHHLKKKAWITTGVTLVIWAALCYVIITGLVSVDSMDWTQSLPPIE